ncbi:MAG: translocation protein TolB, partial [Simkaniaceae bacterium]|nr:translocation protein TolB [Simkaniaceae bacterium]
AGGRADLFIQNIDTFHGIQAKPIQVYSFPSSVQASPTFSPDSRKIAFVSDKEGTPRIYLIDTPLGIVGSKRPDTVCLTTKHRENTCPSWSPDGRKLAYSAKVDGIRQIWIYDFDKNEEMPLTTGPLHKENPSWASNSFHLIYNTCDNDESELYVVNLNGKTPRRITNGLGKKHYPSWEH